MTSFSISLFIGEGGERGREVGVRFVELNTGRGISGTIMTISKDRVKPSPLPDSWKLAEIFTTGVILGAYLAMMTVIFFWAAYKTDFFPVR